MGVTLGRNHTVHDPIQPGEESGSVRARRYARFVRDLIALHPKLFTVAVLGAFVFAICTVASSIALRWVIDHVILPRFEEGSVATGTVVTGCALIVGIGVVRAAAVVVRRTFATAAMWRMAESLGKQVTDRYVAQPASWHQRYADGQLVARAGVDVDTTIGVMAPIPFATSTVLLVIIAAGWLLWTDPVVGAVAVAVIPVLIVVNIIYERVVNRHYTRAQDALGEFSGAVHESFEGVQLVKAYGAEPRETVRLSEMAGEIRDARVHAVRLLATFEAALDVVPALTNIALVVVGALRVRSGDLTVGELSASVFMFTLLVFPLRLFGYALSELPLSYAGYRRVREVVDAPLDTDPETTIGDAPPSDAVALSHVSFTFPDEDEPTLVDTDIEIPTGSVTAFVGATGSGKTTMVELLGGLVGPTTGQVQFGEAARDRRARAIVFQEAFLFGGTVRDNVSMFDEIDDDDVWEALRLASADDFVRELPSGLDTVVGERGVTLSGGQRQRVALARALVRRPALLLLDDTTSALDPATEQAVLNNLRGALAGTTVVMVASRPSTIALADDVLFVSHGRVTAHGKHDELLRDVAEYRQLVEAFETDRGDR